MYILYRHPETQTLTLTETSNTQYNEDEQTLTFIGDDDVSISVSKETSDELVRKLFEEGKLDISSYECEFYEWDDDDEDEDDEDEDASFFLDPGVVIQFD